MKRTLALTMIFLLIPAVLMAHVYIMERSPEPEAIVEASPEKVVMTFLGNIEPAFSRIEVFSPGGKKVSGDVRFLEENTIMETDLAPGGGAGTYTVKYKCMSTDGHLQKGEYTFAVK